MGHLRPQGIVGIGIGQQGQDGQQNLGNGQSRRPLILENIQADHAGRVHIRMIDLRCKGDLGGLKGIVRREMNIELKDPAGIGGIGGPHDHAGPVIEILLFGATGAATGGVLEDILEFLVDTLECHDAYNG